ncbi:hypothetical protein LF1_40430 [Rubripirellula obstinata]|uniref:Uncharacterized protein n=1 Tax=Rubripirellula obstinata TaxID=406547 RepID=A0A5B1CQ37_9BACT|nr:YihY/virulence factor BrkB family protein [Rubripirellula obstinata]KAA1261493.1 hypothetical protein LF1_40430 [Rubripirellula obstinata]
MNFLKQTFAEFAKNRCGTLAAALAYYTAFALPPLLYLMMMLLTFGLSIAYDGDQANQRAERLLQNQAAQLIGNPSATSQIDAILDNAQQTNGKWWKTLISFVGIVVGATGVVAALQDALNQVWEVKPDPENTGIKDLIGKRILSFAMILGLGFLLLVSLVVSSLLAALGEEIGQWTGMSETVAMVANFVVQALVVFLIFAAIFKFMPDAKTDWRDVAVGAVVTTVLFLVGRYGMQLYFSMSDPGAQLGSAAASLAVLLVWVYFSAMIVLLGAEVTQVYAVRFGRGIRPESKSVRVVEKIVRDSKAATS